jgi:hypothetical protein
VLHVRSPDAAQAAIASVTGIEDELKACLKRYRKELDDTSILFRDIGTKEIYQVRPTLAC